MAVSRKGKRPITVDGRRYLWWVQEDGDLPFVPSDGRSLCVADTEGDMFVQYHLGQPSDVRHIVVIGRRFPSVDGCGGTYRRFLCPSFDDGPAVTPAHVAAFIRWLETCDNILIEVDYLGQPLETSPPRPS